MRAIIIKLHKIALLSIILTAFLGTECFADFYSTDSYGNSLISGTLPSNSLGLTVGGSWTISNTAFSWDLSRDIVGGVEVGPWHYSYTFTADNDPTLSHLVLEVSSDVTGGIVGPFTLAPPDYLNGPNADMQTYTSSDSSNPSASGDNWSIYGIKFEGFSDSETSWTLTFDSWRNPMWGSFYTKAGSNSYAYNTGLAGGDAFVAVPDTSYVPIPSAVLLGMLGLGVAGVKLRRFV